MNPRRVLAALAGLAVLGGLIVAYLRYVQEAEARLDPGDLRRRVALSNPDWANYQEDIKAQIGAAPVAQWQGKPVRVWRDGAVIQVTFKLEGPWAERDMVIPVLIRDPLGHERRHLSYSLQLPEVIYSFQLGEEASEALIPWIVVKYPHHEERLTLDSTGRWSAK